MCIMDSFGIHRPGTRYGLEIRDVSEMAAKTEFGVFKDALAKVKAGRKGVVKAIRVPAPNEKLTRKVLDGYSDFAKTFKAGGLPYTKLGTNGFETGRPQFLQP